MSPSGTMTKLAAGAAVVFGILTIVSGGKALTNTASMGAVVPFVLWFNFFAGFAYVGAGLLLWRRHRYARTAALAIFAATLLVFAAFAIHALTGGAYEMRTVGAMTLRSVFWGAMTWAAGRAQGR